MIHWRMEIALKFWKISLWISNKNIYYISFRLILTLTSTEKFFVMSHWTTSVPKQTPDVTYWEKNGDVAGMLKCHFTLTWPNLLYPHTFFDWPAIWTFLGKRLRRFRRDRWNSECVTSYSSQIQICQHKLISKIYTEKLCIKGRGIE